MANSRECGEIRRVTRTNNPALSCVPIWRIVGVFSSRFMSTQA